MVRWKEEGRLNLFFFLHAAYPTATRQSSVCTHAFFSLIEAIRSHLWLNFFIATVQGTFILLSLKVSARSFSFLSLAYSRHRVLQK